MLVDHVTGAVKAHVARELVCFSVFAKDGQSALEVEHEWHRYSAAWWIAAANLDRGWLVYFGISETPALTASLVQVSTARAFVLS